MKWLQVTNQVLIVFASQQKQEFQGINRKMPENKEGIKLLFAFLNQEMQCCKPGMKEGKADLPDEIQPTH